MSIPILCPECKNYLGEFEEFIEVAKKGFYKEILKKENDISEDTIFLHTEVSKPIGFILDALNINLLCCRTHLICNHKNINI